MPDRPRPEFDGRPAFGVVGYRLPEESQRSRQQPGTGPARHGGRQRLLGKFLAGSVGRHRQMCVARCRHAQPLLQPDLARRRIEQIGAANDIGDPGIGVVDDHGQLVGELPVGAQQDEIADLALEIVADAALHPVVEGDSRIGNTQSPCARIPPGRQAVAATSRIDRTTVDRSPQP